MSNRKGGHYDASGDWIPPYKELSLWRKIVRDVIAYAVLIAILGGLGWFTLWTWERNSGAPDDEPPTYYDPSRSGWTR